jgi:hypothetical protein
MKDQIQLSAASAPATTNQNGSFRFTDATRPDGTGNAPRTCSSDCSTTTPNSAPSR